MTKKQLLFALRRLGRHKLTTAINILGLTFGILSCVVIYLYVAFEFSYDKFHADYIDRGLYSSFDLLNLPQKPYWHPFLGQQFIQPKCAQNPSKN